MAQQKKAVADSTANTDKQETKGINIPSNVETCVKTQSMTSGNTKLEVETQNNTNIEEKKSKAGKKPIFQKVENRLDDLTNYISQGMENKKVAEMLDICESSFYHLLATEPQFKQAYEAGIDNRKYTLEKALLKRAEGFTAEETQTVVTDDPKTGRTVKNTTTKKNYVPDSVSLIFALKNLYSDKYKDRIESVSTVNVNVQQINNMSNEELLQCATNVEISLDDYSIE